MGYICDFCGEQRSMVYCRSDAACLCLSCDQNVHSANALSRRHSRTLVCERCNSQPALVRCTEERISLCQNCDWVGHSASTSLSTHKRQTINCYSGCPSAGELSSIWSFVLDIQTMGESSCEQELGMMSINENSSRSDWVPPPESQDASGLAQVTDIHGTDKSCVGPSSMPESRSEPRTLDHPTGAAKESLSKLYCPGRKGSGLYEDDDNLYGDFDIDEVDLNLENYEELFGVALSHSEELFENGGIDNLFGTKEMSAGDSIHQAAAEGSSVGLVSTPRPACSNAASADSLLSTKTEPILSFTGKQAQSNLSFSGVTVTRESGGVDYQDCGASSVLLTGEPPWCPPCPESSLKTSNRSDAVVRYKEKKKTRKFERRVRYASRKARADVRRRVKGRFVKVGEAYDYDPLSQTRSY